MSKNPIRSIKTHIFFSPDFRGIDDIRRWIPKDTLIKEDAWEQMQIGSVVLCSDEEGRSSLVIRKVSPLVFFDQLLACYAVPEAFLTSQDQYYDLVVATAFDKTKIYNRLRPTEQITGLTVQLKAETKRCLYDSLRFCESVFPELVQSDRFSRMKKQYYD